MSFSSVDCSSEMSIEGLGELTGEAESRRT